MAQGGHQKGIRPLPLAYARGSVLPDAALSHGIGSDSQRPFAIVIVGGLMVAMLLNIFLLPTLYVWVAGRHDLLSPVDTMEEV